MKITKADFDKAVAEPWAADSCLLAQAIYRNGGAIDGGISNKFSDSKLALYFMNWFDAAHDGKSWLLEPDEQLTALAMLRSVLPMDV